MRVAFDVDDTLLIPAGVLDDVDVDTPNYPVISIFHWFQAQGHEVWVWSGGGEDYARMWCNKLGLKPDRILSKWAEENGGQRPDIAFDDANVDLATVNVKVRRINNHIVRYYDRVQARREMERRQA